MKTTRISAISVLVLVAGLPTGIAKADFTCGTPTNLGPIVNSSSGDAVTCFSSDGLEMYFVSNRSGGYGGWDIWVTRRPTKDDDWGTPVNLGPTVNSSYLDAFAHISADGLELYFESKRPGGVGGGDIWVAKRATRNDEWGMPVNLGTPVNTSGSDSAPRLSTDGLELYYGSGSRGYGAHDIWVSRRATRNDPWMPAVNLGPVVNSWADEFWPFVSTDGLALFFSGNRGQPLRPRGFGNSDMWVTRRASVSESWSTPVNLGPVVNSPSHECGPVISPDGFTLYFCSERPGGLGGPYGDIYQTPIIPIIDFNGDEIVDIHDLLVLIDNWGTSESLCDIGLMPWGDGIVDVQDLDVLMSYWGQEFEFPPFDLLAYWKLDETEGDIAYESAAMNDAVVFGGAVWQPDGGQVGGALAFDGIDDYVSTPFVLNPAHGAFRVFAWIKGGVAGEVVLSQIEGANWLCTDSLEGNLMTGLSRPAGGRIPPQPLVSEFVITDGNWHHIGLVWDGAQRILYVDDVEVTRDVGALSALKGSENGLYIGAGSSMEQGTFWSGLIDDVRIYNRAMSP